MKRRRLMTGALAAGALAAWPRWLRVAFAGEPNACPPGVKKAAAAAAAAERWVAVVSSAYRRAAAAGKPLLVLVVPAADEAERYERGALFGAVLNHADDATMAALALAEVTCAPMAAVTPLFPAAPAGEPLALVVETDALPAHTRAVAPAVPRATDEREGDLFDPGAWKREDALVDRKIAAVGAALREALAPDAATVERRARQQEARVPAQQAMRLRAQAAAAKDLPLADVDAAAALVYEAALRAPAARAAPLHERLAAAARARLGEHRVPGSRWASSHGCGTRIEWEPGERDEDTIVAIGCGMGHVPRKSARFLDFLTADGTWRKEVF